MTQEHSQQKTNTCVEYIQSTMPLPEFLKPAKSSEVILNRYAVDEILGVGTYGSVYKVKDKKNGNVVRALKSIKLSVDGSAEGGGLGSERKSELETALKEARLLAALDHPNIVHLTHAFEDRSQFYIVMDFCQAGTLCDAIDEAARGRTAFSTDNIVCWLAQLAAALQYIHQRKILHRDLKSKNVFLQRSSGAWPNVQIGDFGISRQLAGTLDEASTCIGTPYYFSPELFKQQGYNSKADLWALGCLLFEMRLLRHPFHPADNLPQLMHKVVTKEPDYGPDWDTEDPLRVVAVALLTKNPRKRPDATQILRTPPVFHHIKKHDIHVAVE